MNDGILEYTMILKSFTYQYFLGLFPLFAGKLKSARFVRRGTFKELKINATGRTRKVRIDYDGDSWGFLPVRFRVLEKALSIVR